MKSMEAWASKILERPVVLAIALWCARLVVYPYAGIIHDAQLYAFQAQQRATGRFSTDLFFLHGSQDQYSVFSLVTAPFLSLLGLKITFYALFLLSSFAFLVAQARLVSRLVSDRLVALTSLVVLTVADLPYGGWGIFQVHESFLTPRLMSCALALWALDDFLAGHRLRAWGVSLLAALLHPLMAASSWAVLIGCQFFSNRPRLTVASLLIAIASGVIGFALAPRMEAQWLEVVRQISPQCFPMEWKWTDGVHIALCLTACLAGQQYLHDFSRSMVRWVVVVASAGLMLSIVAQYCPVPIVIQAQPMRALWLLEFFSIPMALLCVRPLWRRGTLGSQAMAFATALWALRLRPIENWADPWFYVMAMAWAALAFLVLRFMRAYEMRRALWSSLGMGLMLATFIEALAAWAAIRPHWDALMAVADPLTIVSFGARANGSILPLMAAVAILGVILRGACGRPHVIRAAWCLALVIPAMGAYRLLEKPTVNINSLSFLHKFLEDFALRRGEPPTVYWPTDVRHVWFGLEAKCYFHFVQLQGGVFKRETALESRRRAEKVRPFEIARAHREPAVAANWDRLGRILGTLDSQGAPKASDLRSLCEDPFLDLVVLSNPVPGLSTISDGRIWIYECSAIRSARGSPSSDVVAERR